MTLDTFSKDLSQIPANGFYFFIHPFDKHIFVSVVQNSEANDALGMKT